MCSGHNEGRAWRVGSRRCPHRESGSASWESAGLGYSWTPARTWGWLGRRGQTGEGRGHIRGCLSCKRRVRGGRMHRGAQDSRKVRCRLGWRCLGSRAGESPAGTHRRVSSRRPRYQGEGFLWRRRIRGHRGQTCRVMVGPWALLVRGRRERMTRTDHLRGYIHQGTRRRIAGQSAQQPPREGRTGRGHSCGVAPRVKQRVP